MHIVYKVRLIAGVVMLILVQFQVTKPLQLIFYCNVFSMLIVK